MNLRVGRAAAPNHHASAQEVASVGGLRNVVRGNSTAGPTPEHRGHPVPTGRAVPWLRTATAEDAKQSRATSWLIPAKAPVCQFSVSTRGQGPRGLWQASFALCCRGGHSVGRPNTTRLRTLSQQLRRPFSNTRCARRCCLGGPSGTHSQGLGQGFSCLRPAQWIATAASDAEGTCLMELRVCPRLSDNPAKSATTLLASAQG